MKTKIIINDINLSEGQVITLTVALNNFLLDLDQGDLAGEPFESYRQRLYEIFKIIRSNNPPQEAG